jgi:phosphoglycerate kinase
MKNLQDVAVDGKRVLIRADLNVPLNEKREITDKNRIKQFLPTLKFVLENGGKPIVMSHLGRPEGKKDPAASLKPVAECLSELLSTEVFLAPDCVGAEVERLAQELQPGQVLLLENLRFRPQEKSCDPEFSRKLASLADIYVNDAFATAHRSHASMTGVPQYIGDAAIGFLMQKEVEYYERALLKPAKPLCVVLGGAKVSSKLEALINMADKADKILIGGAMANTFLAAQGMQMGRSLYEPELFSKTIELIGNLARRGCHLYLPVDLVVAPSPDSVGLGREVPALEVPADTMALDIGPATRILYKEALQNAETIVWNGPMGFFEKEDFSAGTSELTETIASSHGLTVVGGGDTAAAVHQMELEHKFDYISTGGGAFLTLMEGKPLPALKALGA